MGRHPTGSRKYEITHMWARHKLIVTMAAEGLNNKQIAEALDCTPQTVSNTLNSQVAQDELVEIQQGQKDHAKMIVEQIADIAPRAIEVLEDLMDDDMVSPNTRANIANKFLDRAGHMPTQKVQSIHGHFVASNETLNEIKENAKKAGIQIPEGEEAQFTEVTTNEAIS